jgi:hypothetical protein
MKLWQAAEEMPSPLRCLTVAARQARMQTPGISRIPYWGIVQLIKRIAMWGSPWTAAGRRVGMRLSCDGRAGPHRDSEHYGTISKWLACAASEGSSEKKLPRKSR